MLGRLVLLLRTIGRFFQRLLGAVATEAELSTSRSQELLGARERPIVVGGRFELQRLAGQGGMGKVYRARDGKTGATVAVKLLLPGGGEEEQLRFEREATVLAGLAHPGIVGYVAHGFTDDGEPYLVMEWLQGEDLDQRLRRGELGVDAGVSVVAAVAEALAEAHRQGVVHRDVKPSNIYFEEAALDRVRILDFGVARIGGGDRALTVKGAIVGTPGYMAPEQARGEACVDARADVFALGCVLYECVSGHRPFVANDVMAVLLKILLDDPPRLGEVCDGVSQELEDLVAAMLAKTPARRPADGAAVVAALASEARHSRRSGSPVAVPSMIPASLTSAERRVLCVALARAPAGAPPSPDALRAIVRQKGGRLDVLADGSLLVTVPSGGAATDQARVAARCAIALRDELPALVIAVVAGRAEVAGRLPVGEVIERGVRLMSEGAAAGVIRLDDTVSGLLAGRFEVGGDERALTLGGERDDAEAARTLLGKPTPCVGRDRELATLGSLFEECIGEPVARAALIVAPPGVGKSRLVRETLARIEARGGAVEIWTGRGDALAAGAPFGVIAPALRRSANVLDGEPPAVRRHKLCGRIGRHVSRDDLPRIAEFVGEMVGVPFPDEDSVQLRAARRDPLLMSDQMRRAWEDFLAAETRAQPVVIILEDMHWGDLPTVSLVDSSLRALPDAPLLVLATARPEIDKVFPSLWAGRGVLEVCLTELTRKGSERLVRDVLGDRATDAVVERLVDRSAGNAFYLEELIRAVADGGGDALPETVLAMVQARLEALEPDARRVLRAASVFGDTFWRGGVDALLGDQPSGAWLERLATAETVAPRPRAKFKGEEELVFRHGIVREAAYAMLTAADRELGHRLAADWLEARGESDALVLAEHFERGGQAARAVAWYRAAAAQALGGNDLTAALARAERGLACLASSALDAAGADRGADAEDEVRGALHLIRAESFRWRGEHAAAREQAHAAMRWLPRRTGPWHDALGVAATACTRLGDEGLDALLEALEGALPAGRAFGSYVVAMGRCHGATAVCGRADSYRALAERLDGLPPDRVAEEPVAYAMIEVSRGFRALYRGDPGIYLERLEAGVKGFERAGDQRTACQHRVNVGDAYLELGAYEHAEASLEAGCTEADQLGVRAVAAFARMCLALARARLGRVDEGEALARQSLEALRELGDRRLEGVTRTYLALIALARGEDQAAQVEARKAVELLRDSVPFQVHAKAVLARVLLRADRPEETEAAARLAREAFEALLREGGVEEGDSYVRLVHAEALRAAGQIEAADAALDGAAARLLERAGRIPAPWRESFLTRVPENARTLELAGSRGHGGTSARPS